MRIARDKTKSEPDFSQMRKILIIRLGKIGDIVVTSFVFEIIKSNYPQIDIYLLTLKSNQDVLEFNPRLKKGFYSRNNVTLFWNLLKLKFFKFDLLLDFNDNQSTTSSLIFRFLRAKFKVAYNYKKYKNILDIKINPLMKNESHIIERMKDFLIQLGIPIFEYKVKPFFYLNPTIYTEIKKLRGANEKIIAINLSAGAKIRYWDKDKWVELLRLILKEYPSFSFLLLSVDKDESLRNEIHSKLIQTRYPAIKNLTIQHFASYIQISDILITPDTSAVHIASALGIPTIAMYPNYDSNFVSWQPYKIPYRSIKSNTESVKEISVNEVFDAFQSLVNEILRK
jgi:ADP-heptose:LPS heptosyltransferase